jgi:dihydropteroate synthase
MFVLPPNRPALMGILNVTPDSFSDGGTHFEFREAVDWALRMMDEGADLIDVGGESTRPGAPPVPEDEEIRRVIPVIDALTAKGVPVSADTMKPAVAKAALGAGAKVVNDVGGMRDPAMVEVCARADCTVCAMHMQGSPRTMQQAPRYDDVVEEVRVFLLATAGRLAEAGVVRERIWIDPGIGFGKTLEHNLALLKHLGRFVETGYPVLVGVSRKSFIGKLLSSGEAPLPVEERLEGTLAAQAWAQIQGAKVIRAHDVQAARRVIDTLAGIKGD